MSRRDSPVVSGTFTTGLCFLLLAITLIAVAFSTNHWLDYVVHRERVTIRNSDMKNTPVYFTRYRGLLFTCYPKEAAFLDQPQYTKEAWHGRCLMEEGYEIPTRNPRTVSYSNNYDIRMHLMRSHFAAMALTVVFLLLAVFMAGCGCWKNNPRLLTNTALLGFVAMFFGGIGTAFFHGYHYLEVNILREVPYTPAWIEDQAKIDPDYASLIRASRIQYGYSYILEWLGLTSCAIATILFCIRAFKMQIKRRLKSLPTPPYINPAYGYVLEEYPPLMPSTADGNPVDMKPRPAYRPPEVMYFESSPYDFGGSYRY